MISCGSQIPFCDLPIRFDTYKGCTHNCKYCFVQRLTDIRNVEVYNSKKQLINFINGNRSCETNWCDWNIPIHWGGMSDPFQPLEAKYQVSKQCLKIFADSGYPFVVSTKGKLVAEDDYVDLIKNCNCVLQVSMVCNKYDKIELGAPTYDERLKIIEKLAPHCKRVIVRVQPYMTEVLSDVLKNIPRLKEVGVYGITIEGMKFITKKAGLVKLGGDMVYPTETLKKHFTKIKQQCNKYGLKFYCAENRLRKMGDSLTCCGCEGIEGFKANTYNLCHIVNNDNPIPTKRMQDTGTAHIFNSCYRKAGMSAYLKDKSFSEIMRSKQVHDTYIKVLK